MQSAEALDLAVLTLSYLQIRMATAAACVLALFIYHASSMLVALQV